MLGLQPAFDGDSTVYDADMDFEGMEQSDSDKKLVAIFFMAAVHHEAESIKAGRPIFKDQAMIRIITPGSRDDFIGDATEEYKQRFPKQWLQFKRGREQLGSGTPLNQLVWLTPGQIAEFNALNIRTVEQLAGMPDALSQKFMGHHQIKQRAQAYLDAAKAGAPLAKMEAALHERDQKLAEQEQVIKDLAARLEAVEAKKVKE